MTEEELSRIWLDKVKEGYLPERVDCPDGSFITKNVYTGGYRDGYERGVKGNCSKKAFDNRGRFIDWCLMKYPDVVKQYLGFEE